MIDKAALPAGLSGCFKREPPPPPPAPYRACASGFKRPSAKEIGNDRSDGGRWWYVPFLRQSFDKEENDRRGLCQRRGTRWTTVRCMATNGRGPSESLQKRNQIRHKGLFVQVAVFGSLADWKGWRIGWGMFADMGIAKEGEEEEEEEEYA